MHRKVLVVGLDAAPPELIFDKLKNELPILSSLLDGYHGALKSTHPPITIPAWISMITGKSPGTLGLYGFRHRKPGTYNEFWIANSKMVKEKTIWDLLGEHKLKSIIIGVPPTYPPKPIRGYLITDFITPSTQVSYTYPPTLKFEIKKLVGEYIFDVKFRTEERNKLIKELWNMTKQHFEVIRYLAKNKNWDFMMFVEIGVDRVQHAFWGFMDPEHHKYVPGNKYENVIIEYYKLIDQELGKLLEIIPKDTMIIVVSDHGAKRMKGAFVINQWFAEQGYLKFEEEPKKVMELSEAKIRWEKTYAWGWGGYYARVFINLKGREPKGTVDPRDYEDFREQLIKDLKRIRGPKGEHWNTIVVKPEDLYPEVKGNPPDLMVYFDNLYWRSAGTVGWPTLYLPENDRGPDDAVHDWEGILIIHDPEGTISKKKVKANIEDIAPTILSLYEIETYKKFHGKQIM